MGGRGDGGEGPAEKRAARCPPAPTARLTNRRREAEKRLCRRRQLLLTEAPPFPAATEGRARVRAILPPRPDSEGPGKGEGD